MQKKASAFFSRFQFLIMLTVLLLLPLILSSAFTRPYLDSKRAFLNFIMPLGIGSFFCTLLLSKEYCRQMKYLFIPFVYILFIFISALNSSNIPLSMFTAAQQFIIICGGFWLGFSLYGKPYQMGKVVIVITFVAVFVSIHSFSQFIGQDFLYRFFPWRIVEGDLIHYRHIPATLGNPDYVGGFLMILSFWILIGYILFQKNYFFFFVFLVTVFVTIITQTRSAIIGLVGAMLFLLFHFRRIQNIHMKKKFVIILILSLILLIAATFLSVLLFSNFVEFFINRFQDAFMFLESSFKVRLLHWQLTTEMFRENWIWGISPGMYRIRYLDYLLEFAASPASEPFENVIRTSGGRLAGEAHNDFFQIFSEYGVLAGAVFLFILVLFFVSAYWYYSNNLPNSHIILIFNALIIATLIHAFFSFPFQLYVRSFYIWFTFGTAFSIIFSAKKSSFY